MPSFRDLEQKWAPKVEALLGNNGGGRRREWQRERERKKLSEILGLSEERESVAFWLKKKAFLFSIILFFSKALATCPILSGTKRAHLFLLM